MNLGVLIIVSNRRVETGRGVHLSSVSQIPHLEWTCCYRFQLHNGNSKPVILSLLLGTSQLELVLEYRPVQPKLRCLSHWVPQLASLQLSESTDATASGTAHAPHFPHPCYWVTSKAAITKGEHKALYWPVYLRNVLTQIFSRTTHLPAQLTAIRM